MYWNVPRIVPCAVIAWGGVVGNRMGESRDGPCLAVEALAELRVGGEAIGKDLDGDRAVQPRVTRAVDLPHSSSSDGREDLIRPEARSRGQRHGLLLDLLQFEFAADSATNAAEAHGNNRNTLAPLIWTRAVSFETLAARLLLRTPLQ